MKYTRILKYGTSGEDVLFFKQKLLALGYYADHITEVTRKTYGSDTAEAVRRFQEQAGLTVDGIVGKETWEALFGETAEQAQEIVKAEPSETAQKICALALTRIGDVYSWGDEGQDAMGNSYIGKHDNAEGKARSIAFRDKQVKAGITGLQLYDCSGFISWLMMQHGLMSGRRDCDGLWGMCKEIQRNELIAGDWIFRHESGNVGNKTHIGLYIGRGMVVHAKGRDVGVIHEGINKGGSGYWHLCGRCKLVQGG